MSSTHDYKSLTTTTIYYLLMVQQHVELVAVANFPGTKTSQAFKTSNGHVLTMEQVRNMIDKGVSIIIHDKNSGSITSVTKRGHESVQAVRNETKEDNIDSLEEFEL
jgi:hypothetical protein